MPMELQGFDNLKDDLTNMASNLEFGAGVNRALQEGAKPIEEQMLHNASSDPQIITGALHDSIRTHSVRKSRSGGKYITIGVKHSQKGAYYANPVEKGHGGPAPAPAHPFVRPAFDVRKDEAYLYPSLYLLPTYNSTTNRTVFEGSYVGASSFSSWEDGTGNNRRMLEVRNAAYQASLDFAVLLRTCTGGTWASYRLFHAGMATPIPLANGGTGASSAKAALANLGIFYSASLPSSGTDGQICLVPV